MCTLVYNDACATCVSELCVCVGELLLNECVCVYESIRNEFFGAYAFSMQFVLVISMVYSYYVGICVSI